MAYDYTQAGWSPEVLDYVQGLDAQRNALIGKYAGQNVGLDNPDFLTPQQVQQEASDGFTTQFAPEDVVRAYMAKNPLNAENELNAGVDIRSYGDSRDPSVYDTIRLPFGDTYTLTDKASGKSYSASTPEELQTIQRMVSGMSSLSNAPMKDSTFGGGNNTANWEVTRNGERVAYDSPYTPSFLKQAGQTLADIGTDYALPALGAAIAGPLGAGFTTAAVQGIGKDKSLEDSLKAGALSALTSYGMGQISPYINSSLTKAGLDFPGMDAAFAPETPSFWGAAGGGGTYGDYLGNVGGVESAVSGAVRPNISALAMAFPGLTAAQLAQLASYDLPAEYGEDSVTVTGEKPGSVLPAAAGLTALGTGSALAGGAAPADSVVVDAPATNGGMSPAEIALIAAATGGGALAASGAAGAGAKDPSIWDQALKYSPLLALLGGLGGTGGAGAGGAGTIPKLANKETPSIFSAKLPTSRVVSPYTVTPNQGTEDWTKYGFGKEKSFFSNIPGTPIGYAKGGLAVKRARSHVRGPGTGTSDSIPALLSDGEYVIDRATMDLAGSGDNDKGAKVFDKLRVDIRSKGKKARGPLKLAVKGTK